MTKQLDLLLSIAGILFLALLGMDLWKSDSIIPEGLIYTILRSPEAYPSAVREDIKEIQLSADRELEARTVEMSGEIRKQIEESKTGCVSFRGLPNAICVGTKQTES